jgi:L-lactate dehydrogenase complex protein LldG
MAGESDARAAILSSMRGALRVPAERDPSVREAEYAALPREYKHSSTRSTAELLELFSHRLVEYDAGVQRVAPAQIPDAVAKLLRARGRASIAIPEGLSAEWLPAGFQFVQASAFDAHQLDTLDGVLTGCTVAIAETGSIVLQNAAAQGPRALSLVPDYHLCVVFAAQVVETVPECFARLQATAHLPTTFVSGPSATADIEMTRIKGVHGPRFLDVLIVAE